MAATEEGRPEGAAGAPGPPAPRPGAGRGQRAAAWTVLAGLAVFAGLLGAAMAVYPGGPDAGYRFWGRFLSTLGFTVTFSGRPNPTASLLFTLALLLTAAGLLPTVLTAPARLFAERWRARLARGLGLCSCLGFLLVGLCPYDRAPGWHMLGVVGGFLPWFALSLLLATRRGRRGAPRRLLLLVLPALLTLHALQGVRVLLTGRLTADVPAVQKLVVLWIMLLLAWDAVRVLRAPD
jgi:hypothetical protein